MGNAGDDEEIKGKQGTCTVTGVGEYLVMMVLQIL